MLKSTSVWTRCRTARVGKRVRSTKLKVKVKVVSFYSASSRTRL